MSAYLDGDLASRPRLRLERHTGACAECRGVLYSLRRMLERLRGLPVNPREATDIASAVRRRLRDAAEN
jgi:anti-sigma factor RsiW